MGMKGAFFLFWAVTAMAVTSQDLKSQDLYSYWDDETGTQVFTNIAPVKPVRDLKITSSIVQPADPGPLEKSGNYDAIIEKYAGDFRLNPDLIRSIIATESGFNPQAVSPKGARGLMQLMPATAERLGVSNSFDPEENIRGGVKHFRSLMDIFNNDLALSLAAYNAGENLVQRLGRVPEIKETREYVQSVKKRYSKTQIQEEPKYQPIKYLDESGVLHLTNVPRLH